MNINGSIGYTLLSKDNIKVLVLADMHSTLPYCKGESIFVSDWMDRKKKSKILLEEVPRLGSTLKELWPGSPHTQKLKDLYLNSKVIDGVDVRPFLIPFSWELISEDKELGKVTLYEYLTLIDFFFQLKHKFFIKNLGNIYTKDYLKDSKLGVHFLNLKNKTQALMKKNKSLIKDKTENLIDKEIMIDLNELISLIMEWYIIAKVYKDINEKQTNFIIHAGLAHTSNVISVLKDIYAFQILETVGSTDYDKDKNNFTDGCLKLPSKINDLFGGAKYYL